MANADPASTIITVRIPNDVLQRLDTLVGERKERAKPAPLSRNTVIVQVIERAVSAAEYSRPAASRKAK